MGLFKKKEKQQEKIEKEAMGIVLAEMDNAIVTGEVPLDFDPKVSINITDVDGIVHVIINTLEEEEAKNYEQKFKRPNVETKVIKWLETIGYERFGERVLSSINSM